MGIYAVKPAFRRRLEGVERMLIARGVTADGVTIAGLVFALVGAGALVLGRGGTVWLVVVPFAAFARIASNALDGMIAGSTGTSRPLGDVLNELADRVEDIIFFVPLLVIPGVSALALAVALIGMLITAYLALAVKAAGGPRGRAGIMGKADRMAVLSIAAVSALWVDPGRAFTAALWAVVAGVMITFVQRSLEAVRLLSRTDTQDPGTSS